jgi:hypothetical protein
MVPHYAGIQLFGTCTDARGAEVQKAETLYASRFSAYAGWTEARCGVSALMYLYSRDYSD